MEDARCIGCQAGNSQKLLEGELKHLQMMAAEGAKRCDAWIAWLCSLQQHFFSLELTISEKGMQELLQSYSLFKTEDRLILHPFNLGSAHFSL